MATKYLNTNSFIVTIEARLGSTRLPNKVLLPFGKVSAIELLIERIKKSKYIKKIVVSTTTNKRDDKLVNILEKKKIRYFRGSELNVLFRLVSLLKKNNEGSVIHLTADNPLIDHRVIDYVIDFYLSNLPMYDFVTTGNIYKKKKNFFPLGMGVSVFKRKKIEEVFRMAVNYEQLEHPMITFYREGKNIFKSYSIPPIKKWKKKFLPRLTMDTVEDYTFLKTIYKNLNFNKFISLSEILDYLEKNKSLMKINRKSSTKYN
jgi:spore coat polysaccharide biosynthesis protein SpsF